MQSDNEDSVDVEYYDYSSDEYMGDGDGDGDGDDDDDSDAGDMEYQDDSDNQQVSNSVACHINIPPAGITVYSAEELYPEMARQISDVQEVLGISSAAVSVLMRQHKWLKDRLLQAYMDDDEKILTKAGVYHRCRDTKEAPKNEPTCEICYDDVEDSEKMAMPCGHAFCRDCWSDFCVNAIQEEGPTCVCVTCPHAGCSEVVTEDEICQILAVATTAKDDDPNKKLLQKYKNYQLRSFIESNPLTRWCPGKGCDRIAFAGSQSVVENSEVAVVACNKCDTSFCLVCGQEPHAPVRCKDLTRWIEKCHDESETANWIMTNTKRCPKCASRIEKNSGCNHITCQQCKHHFCWVCLGDWGDHGENTGGYYNCNKFKDGGEKSGPPATAEERAKRDLERYLHYYRRYHGHQEGESFARKQLQETESRMVTLQEYSESNASKWSDVEFLQTANEQLVKCRHVLKYTYVFGYYLDPLTTSKIQQERFEYQQEMLERFTESLSEMSEKPPSEIERTSVVNQTRVVDRFMKKILEYIEEDMLE